MAQTGMASSLAPERRSQTRMMLGACIGMFLNPSPLVLLSFGVYLLPIIHDTGWNRALIASSVGAGGLGIALFPPLAGWLINRFGPHRVSAIGFPLCGLAIMALGLPTTPVMFIAAMALFGMLSACQTSVLYIYCLSGWFDRRRGIALGAGQAASGLAIAMVPPFAVWLMGMFGWRGTYFVIGLAVMTIGIPVSRWLVLDPPVIAHRTAADVPGLNFRDALRSRVFWLLAVSIFLVGAAASGGMMNLSLMLVERGASPQNASFILSLLGMTMIVARLGCGALFDRMNGRTLTALICAIVGSAFVVLALRSDTQGVMIAAVLIGIGFGAEGDALSYMASRAFGMRAFGTVFGTIFLAYTGGGTLGSVVFPLMHAQTGSYQAAIWSAAAACAVATIFVLMIRDKDLPFMARDAQSIVDADDAMLARA